MHAAKVTNQWGVIVRIYYSSSDVTARLIATTAINNNIINSYVVKCSSLKSCTLLVAFKYKPYLNVILVAFVIQTKFKVHDALRRFTNAKLTYKSKILDKTECELLSLLEGNCHDFASVSCRFIPQCISHLVQHLYNLGKTSTRSDFEGAYRIEGFRFLRA